jgi:hypothetical protein
MGGHLNNFEENLMTLEELEKIENHLADHRIVALYRRIPGVFDAPQDYFGAIEFYSFRPQEYLHQTQRLDFIAFFADEQLVGLVEHLDQIDITFDPGADPYSDFITLKNRSTQIEYRIRTEKTPSDVELDGSRKRRETDYLVTSRSKSI